MQESISFVGRVSSYTRFDARLFCFCFTAAAALLAVFATVTSSSEAISWQAGLYWGLTLTAMWMVARLALMIERCEREAMQESDSAAVSRKRRDSVPEAHLPQMAQRLAQLEQIVVRQHRFAIDAAHELRTPLTAQTLVAESMLARPAVAASDLREAIASMLEESNHMKRLIEGLLDLTRASLTFVVSDGVSRQPAALNLSALVRDCVESLKILAEEKQQTIEVAVADGVWADADLTMVRQALLNVMHNSIEHCPERTHIRVEAMRSSPTASSILVQDNGPGIPLDDQHRVFKRFFRGSGTSRQRSLGLGLSIAKAILCSQGGGIELVSSSGSGCCFILTLPATGAPAPLVG
jgi:signal transduction histidine kinase